MVAITLVLLLGAPGCSYFRIVGVGYRPGDDLTFYIPLCRDDERVLDVRVETYVEPDSGQVGELVWGTRPVRDPGPVTRVGVDARLPGYEVYERRSLVSLVDDHADRSLRVTVRTTSNTMRSVFTISELPTDGWVDFGGVDPVLVDPLDVTDYQDGQCDPWQLPWGVSIALVAMYVGSALALVVFLFNSARHRRRLAGRHMTG